MFSERLLRESLNTANCDLCGQIKEDCISVNVCGFDKMVCSECSGVIVTKLMYLSGVINFEPIETRDKITEQNKNKKKIDKQTPVKTDEDELFTKEEINYIHAVDAGVSVEDIARIGGVSIDYLIKLEAGINEKANKRWIEKWEDEERIKKNKEVN